MSTSEEKQSEVKKGLHCLEHLTASMYKEFVLYTKNVVGYFLSNIISSLQVFEGVIEESIQFKEFNMKLD